MAEPGSRAFPHHGRGEVAFGFIAVLAMHVFWRDCTHRAAVAALPVWPYSMSMVAMSVKSLRGNIYL